MNTTPTSGDTPPARPDRSRRTRLVAIALALALFASLWHVVAIEAYVAAAKPYEPTANRLSAAAT
jgi:hypothetical protein